VLHLHKNVSMACDAIENPSIVIMVRQEEPDGPGKQRQGQPAT